MKTLFVVYLTLFLGLSVQAQSKPETKPARTVVKVAICTRLDSYGERLGVTSLDCGKDDQDEALVFDFPDWFATFPKGKEFRMDFYSDGKHGLSRVQPEGSEIRYSPPCPKKSRNDRSYDDARGALQKAPCNPELKP